MLWLNSVICLSKTARVRGTLLLGKGAKLPVLNGFDSLISAPIRLETMAGFSPACCGVTCLALLNVFDATFGATVNFVCLAITVELCDSNGLR